MPESQDQPLEQLLTDYRRNGVDSEGQFTINPDRARELMKQFQLPEPAYYALHFISFLIGAGARAVFVESHTAGLLFRASGAPALERGVLERPFSALLDSRAEPYLSELALGLNTVLGQKATVELSSGEGRALYSSTEIVVSDSPSGELSLLVQGGGKGEREMQLIAEHFALSPVSVWLGGREPERLAPDSEAVLALEFSNPNYPLPPMSSCPVQLSKITHARFSAVVRLGREVSGARVLHLGRLYTLALPWSCQLPGWEVDVVIASDRFRKDLSQQNLRVDDTFKNIFDFLRQQLDSALLTLPISVATREPDVQVLWNDVVESLADQGRVVEALERQTLLCEHLGLSPKPAVRGNVFYRLGLLQEMLAPGSGLEEMRMGQEILSPVGQTWEMSCCLVRARMAFAANVAGLESAVLEVAKDSRSSPEDSLACFRWLRVRADEGSDTRAVYRCQMAEQMLLMKRPGLALAELDLDSVGPALELALLRMVEAELRASGYSELGQFDKALEWLGKLLILQREEYGQYDLRLGQTLTRLAAILEHLGKAKQAEEYREWSHRLNS